MAKRTRASRSAHRPGGQGPSRTKRESGAEASPAAPVGSTSGRAEDDAVRRSEVEVDEVAVAAVAAATTTPEEPPAQERPAGKRSRRRAARSSKRKSQDDLASRAAAETAWVRGDLRRIGVVSIVLVTLLAVSYVLFGMLDVLGLY